MRRRGENVGNARTSGKCADTRFSSHLIIGADMVYVVGGGDGGGRTKKFSTRSSYGGSWNAPFWRSFIVRFAQ